MFVKFWGVHGSLPCPGPKTLKYGGNTPCVEVRSDGTLLILDAGTGIVELGMDLLLRHRAASGGITKIVGHILLSHFHWDHVHGFAFFRPCYLRENEFHVYGVRNLEANVRTTLERQMAEPNFPIRLEHLAASLHFHDIEPGDSFPVGDLNVTVAKLSHPGDSYGYRIEGNGKVMIYATDTEHVDDEMDEALLKLAYKADLLVYDSMFAPEQYLGLWDKLPRRKWGHSTWEQGVALAQAAKVKRLALFHHGNEDSVIEELEKQAKERFPGAMAAYEGLEIQL
ncbi:MAG: MBL fold metallo-hydrolase [Deltaproteobacteria bacterium]|nr:MBL fold metallo-hydrolase [Deltaproteobacteria bacterium]